MPFEVAHLRFYRGPNIWCDQAGLMALLRSSEREVPSVLADRSLIDRLLRRQADIMASAPVLRQSELLGPDQPWLRDDQPLGLWILGVVEVMVRDFCWQPAIGWHAPVDPGQLRLFMPAADEGVAMPAFKFALRLLELVSARERDDSGPFSATLAEEYEKARAAAGLHGLDPSTIALARGAFGRGIPVTRVVVPGQHTQLGHGANARRVSGTEASLASAIASSISSDRLVTSVVLSGSGIPTAGTLPARTPAEGGAIAKLLGFPLVVRPRMPGTGKGVALDIRNTEALGIALSSAADCERGLLLERYVEGDDHRLLLVNGRLVAASKRLTASATGDGVSIDVTDAVHPENRMLAARAARLIGLDICDVHLRTPNIGRSWREGACAILEIDGRPDLRHHMQANPDRDVASPIIDHLFPAGTDGRVPTVGITGSLGKTTTARMVSAILRRSGRRVALCTTQGAWIDDDCIFSGDHAGGGTAQTLLQDPAVEAGVFELSRGGLLKFGMRIDAVDVGVALNVGDNHLGIDGIATREDLAKVKSIVVRNARHWAILNADDSLCLAMKETTKAEHLCLVSERPRSKVIRLHLANGGTAVTRSDRSSDSFLCLRRGRDILGQIAASDIPATFGGRFNPPIWNAMFAMAAAHALGLPFETIEAALSGFHSDHEANPGRMNWIRGLPFALLLTNADGPVALTELASLIGGRRFPASKTLVFSASGDRPDSFIVDSARAVAGSFDRYVCCEREEDLRGRRVGEVAGLLAAGLRGSGVSETAIQIEHSDSVALSTALKSTVPDALLVVVSYQYLKVMAHIRNLWPLAR